MNLTEMRAEIRTELSDTGTFFSDAEIDRAVQKCVSLMSRFIPKRVIVETTITRDITGETLAISSDTGTLTYKPVKAGSLEIPNKTLDTHYTINYMTGVVTEIGSGLPDTNYTVSYSLDPRMLDISSLLPEENYIKIERIECPVGDDPPTLVTFEVFGETLLVKGKDTGLTEDEHLRIIYLKPWTAPIEVPSVWALNTVIALNEVRRPTTANATGYYYECTARTGDFKTGGTEPTWGTVLGGTTSDDAITWTCIALSNADGDYPEHLDNPVIIGSAGQALIYKAEKYVQQVITDLGTAKTTLGNADTPLSDINSALDKVDTYLAGASDPSAKKYLEDGDAYIVTSNAGQNVAENYGVFSAGAAAIALGFISEAIQRISEANAHISQGREEHAIARSFLEAAGRYLASGQSKINEFLVSIGIKPEFLSYRGSSEQFS